MCTTKATLLTLLLILAAGSATAALPAAVDGEPLPSLAPMLEKATPAVVNISTVSTVRTEDHPLLRDPFFRWFFERPLERRKKHSQSLGSGVIVDARRGHVLTNHHVIEKASEIRVTLNDGRELTAELLGSDPETDVALVQIPAENLTVQSPLATPTGCAWATSWSPSATPLGSARPSPPGSSAHWGAAAWGSRATRTSSRPMPPSIPATPAARWSTCVASWSVSIRRFSHPVAAMSGSDSRSR